MALVEQINHAFGTSPDRIPGKFDPSTGAYVFIAERDINVPPHWSGIVGDVVHNLHAALDYLAWELVAANGAEGGNRTSFPIFQTRAKYNSDAASKIKGMHQDAQNLIERLQPFQIPPRDGHPSDTELWALHCLEQIDKHRTLNLVAHMGDVEFVGLPQSVHTSRGSFPFPFGNYEVGAEVGRVDGMARYPDLDLSLKVTHRVVFAQDGPAPYMDVPQTLRRLHRHVEEIVIPPFRQFF